MPYVVRLSVWEYQYVYWVSYSLSSFQGMCQAIEHMLQVTISQHQQPLSSVTSQASDVLFDAQIATTDYDGETMLENGETNGVSPDRDSLPLDKEGSAEREVSASPERSSGSKEENGDESRKKMERRQRHHQKKRCKCRLHNVLILSNRWPCKH